MKARLIHALVAAFGVVAVLTPILVLALPPGPGTGSCEVCKGRMPNRFCESVSSGGFSDCQEDTYGNCIAVIACGSNVTVTP